MSETSPATPLKPAPSAGAASPPAPRAVVRCLVATKSWTGINAVAFILFGLLVLVESLQLYRELLHLHETEPEQTWTFPTLIVWGQAVFGALMAAGCFYVVPRLFRYSGAVSRLQQAGRMRELENALRHQRIAWIVLGSLGGVWIVFFLLQLFGSLKTLNDLHQMESRDRSRTPVLESRK